MSDQEARIHVILSAYLSIAAGIIEAILSAIAGHADSSMSLYGIGLMAFVDITGSVLVLNLWQFSNKRGPNGERLMSEKIKEMTYSIAIGYLMILLGIFLIMDSLNSFLAHDKPKEMSPMGIMVSIFGATCGLGLAAYKYVVGKAVDSPVVVADSVSSLCAGLTSISALIILYIGAELWWSDSIAGMAIAIYTLYMGIYTIMSSSKERNRLISLDHDKIVHEVLLKSREEIITRSFYDNGRLNYQKVI